MKTVLCFGVFQHLGYDPRHQRPFPRERVRWTGVLTGLLGLTYQVIEEGP